MGAGKGTITIRPIGRKDNVRCRKSSERWPLAALHQDAPLGLYDWWHDRLAALIAAFGERHVANAVAGLFLTPWPSEAFDPRLRLPSRRRGCVTW